MVVHTSSVGANDSNEKRPYLSSKGQFVLNYYGCVRCLSGSDIDIKIAIAGRLQFFLFYFVFYFILVSSLISSSH